MAYLYLGIAIVAEVIATTALKASNGFTHTTWSTVTAVGYAIAFYCLSLTLKQMSTGVAYAIWSGVGIVLIALLAWVIHGEKLDLAALCGMAMILAGVLVINIFSKTALH